MGGGTEILLGLEVARWGSSLPLRVLVSSSILQYQKVRSGLLLLPAHFP